MIKPRSEPEINHPLLREMPDLARRFFDRIAPIPEELALAERLQKGPETITDKARLISTFVQPKIVTPPYRYFNYRIPGVKGVYCSTIGFCSFDDLTIAEALRLATIGNLRIIYENALAGTSYELVTPEIEAAVKFAQSLPAEVDYNGMLISPFAEPIHDVVTAMVTRGITQIKNISGRLAKLTAQLQLIKSAVNTRQVVLYDHLGSGEFVRDTVAGVLPELSWTHPAKNLRHAYEILLKSGFES